MTDWYKLKSQALTCFGLCIGQLLPTVAIIVTVKGYSIGWILLAVYFAALAVTAVHSLYSLGRREYWWACFCQVTRKWYVPPEQHKEFWPMALITGVFYVATQVLYWRAYLVARRHSHGWQYWILNVADPEGPFLYPEIKKE